MIPQAPNDYIIVSLDKTFEDEIQTQSGVKLYKDTFHNPEWNVTVTAKVLSVPKKIRYHFPDGGVRPEYVGMSEQVKAGDEIIFSYMMVFDCELRDRDTPVFANRFYHEGQFYWKVDYQFLLGFIKDGKPLAAQGYVFAEVEETEEQPEKIGLIWMPEMKKKEKPKGRAKVISVGQPKEGEPTLSVKEGDTVRYSEKYAQKYQVLGKTIVILSNDRVLAVEN